MRNGPPPGSPQWIAEQGYRRSFKGRFHSFLAIVILVGGAIFWAWGCTMAMNDIEKILTKDRSGEY